MHVGGDIAAQQRRRQSKDDREQDADGGPNKPELAARLTPQRRLPLAMMAAPAHPFDNRGQKLDRVAQTAQRRNPKGRDMLSPNAEIAPRGAGNPAEFSGDSPRADSAAGSGGAICLIN